jgi:hypothetical protein
MLCTTQENKSRSSKRNYRRDGGSKDSGEFGDKHRGYMYGKTRAETT